MKLHQFLFLLTFVIKAYSQYLNFLKVTSNVNEGALARIGIQNINKTSAVTASIKVSGTATQGNDYSISGNVNVSVPAGNTTDIVIAVRNDGITEGNETIVLTLINGRGKNEVHTVTILGDQALEFAKSSSRVNESDRFAIVQIRNANAATTRAEIVTSGNATYLSDYKFIGGTNVTIDGNSARDIFIQIFDNSIINKVKTVKLQLLNSGAGARPVHTLFIENDDVAITCSGARAKENKGTLTMEIKRTGAIDVVSNTLTCFTISSGTARENSDYEFTSKQISFPKGSSSAKFEVPIRINDKTLNDLDFTINCYTTNTEHIDSSSCKQVQAVIEDSTEGFGFCSDSPMSVKENAGNYTAKICRKSYVNKKATFEVCVAKEKMTYFEKFHKSIADKCEKVTFEPLDLQKNVTFPVKDDSWGEQEESTFEVSVVAGNVPTFGKTKLNVSLIDDDISYCVVVPPSKKSVTVDEDSNYFDVAINRYGAVSSIESQVTLVSQDGTAKSGEDYFNVHYVVNFSKTATTESRNISIINDDLTEQNQIFDLKLVNATPYNVFPDCEIRVGIQSEDANVSCNIGAIYNTSESKSIKLIFTRVGNYRHDHKVSVTTVGDTAKPGEDFIAVNKTMGFPIGRQHAEFLISLIDDLVYKSNKTFKIMTSRQGTGISHFTCPSIITVDIVDNDANVFFCKPLQTSVKENAGQYVIKVCRYPKSPNFENKIQLCWTSDGNGQAHDYPSILNDCATKTFGKGIEMIEHTINITDDKWGEQEFKKFNIEMTSVGPNKAVFNDTTKYNVTLEDDDNSYCLKNSFLTVFEETDKYINLTIVRTGATSTQSSKVLINTNDQTATKGQDFEGIKTNQITFNNGDTEKIVSIKLEDDKIVEGRESFQVTLSGSNGSTVFPSCNSIVTIVSNDVNISCNLSGYLAVFENKKQVVFSLTRAGSIQYPHSIRVKTQDVSASLRSDYIFLDRTVSFSPNKTKEQITVNITNDKIAENNEILKLTFTTFDNRVNILCPNTSVEILNEDTNIFFCKPHQTSVKENAGKYKVDVCRAGRTSVPHLITLCWTSDGNGRLHDYPSIDAGCVEKTFAAGKTKIQHSIKITNDNWGEQEHKTFQLRILSNESTVFFNDTSSYNVTLIDDDNSFCVKKMAYNVTEEKHRVLNILVERFGAISTTVASVRPIALPDQARKALSPDDYEFPNNNQSLMFSLNQVEKNITITIKDDKLTEDHQMFILSLHGVGPSTVFPSCNTSRTTIVSNDVDIRCNGLNSAMQQAFENESPLVVEITREGSIQYNHTIRIRTVADSAKPQSDFIPVDKVITFIAGQKHIQQNVIIVNDLEVEKAERFYLELTSNDPRVNIICKRITYVIKDDDTMVTCPKSALTVSENTKMVTLQFEREGYLNKTSNMWISTLDGTAYDKADYAPENRKNVTFHRGENISSVSIDIVNDDVPEKLESFSILLGSEDNTTTPITSSFCMNITINDDDKDEDRITAKQAQEMLDTRKRISNLLIAGLGAASVIVLILIILLIAVCVCF